VSFLSKDKIVRYYCYHGLLGGEHYPGRCLPKRTIQLVHAILLTAAISLTFQKVPTYSGFVSARLLGLCHEVFLGSEVQLPGWL
jgi:hypothetical protein